MGFGITELVIVLVIVFLLFGTKKLRSLGGDLENAPRRWTINRTRKAAGQLLRARSIKRQISKLGKYSD
jgi:TatA/E family protein of Tat protein translocase